MEKHLWRKTRTYLFLIGICIGILLLELLGITILDLMNKSEYVNDNITEGIIIFICIPGILIGIIGAIISAVLKR
jgi:biotin transporter BioY